MAWSDAARAAALEARRAHGKSKTKFAFEYAPGKSGFRSAEQIARVIAFDRNLGALNRMHGTMRSSVAKQLKMLTLKQLTPYHTLGKSAPKHFVKGVYK